MNISQLRLRSEKFDDDNDDDDDNNNNNNRSRRHNNNNNNKPLVVSGFFDIFAPIFSAFDPPSPLARSSVIQSNHPSIRRFTSLRLQVSINESRVGKAASTDLKTGHSDSLHHDSLYRVL